MLFPIHALTSMRHLHAGVSETAGWVARSPVHTLKLYQSLWDVTYAIVIVRVHPSIHTACDSFVLTPTASTRALLQHLNLMKERHLPKCFDLHL